MKLISENHKSIDPSTLLTVLGGYEVFLPNIYKDSPFICKKGCPLWVKKEDQLYDVFEIENETSWGQELLEIIKQKYPHRDAPFCRMLSKNDPIVNVKEQDQLDIMLSGEVFDYDGNIVLDIQTFDRNLSERFVKKIDELDDDFPLNPTKQLFIKNITDRSFIPKLMEYLTKNNRLERLKGTVVWYDCSGEIDYTKDLGFTETSFGFSYWQILSRNSQTNTIMEGKCKICDTGIDDSMTNCPQCHAPIVKYEWVCPQCGYSTWPQLSTYRGDPNEINKELMICPNCKCNRIELRINK